MRTVLVLAPHTDDETVGAGGYIAKEIAKGSRVIVVAFSDCGNPNTPNEFKAALKGLGMKTQELDSLLLNYQVRYFHLHRQQILEDLIKFRKLYKPDVVLCPSSFDIHQDHKVIREEAKRAFKHCTILGYELPWNCFAWQNDLTVELSNEHLNRKKQAVRGYESQKFRNYCTDEFIESLARVRGIQGNCTFAESFEIIRAYE